MRVLMKKTSEHELLLDSEGKTKNGEYFDVIPDVLADDTADREEKTRSIIAAFYFNGTYDHQVRSSYDVFVFSDEGALTFTGKADGF